MATVLLKRAPDTSINNSAPFTKKEQQIFNDHFMKPIYIYDVIETNKSESKVKRISIQETFKRNN